MSRFELAPPSNGSDDDLSISRAGASDSDDDFENLPYPKPLERSAFLAPDFNAATYLSTLRNRHQTLSDLRADLRQRSQALASELLELVNNEYQSFLTLGADLKGGEEKVENVRMGVLGFRKGIEGVKDGVTDRKREVDGLLKERRKLVEERQMGLKLVEVHTRIGELEGDLSISSTGDDMGKSKKKVKDSDGDEEDDEDAWEDELSDFSLDLDSDEEEGQDLVGVKRLERLVMNYLRVVQMIGFIGPEHPFLVKQQDRLTKIRQTLILDLGTMLKQAKEDGERGTSKMLRVVAMYGDMDEGKAAIAILKEKSKGKAKR